MKRASGANFTTPVHVFNTGSSDWNGALKLSWIFIVSLERERRISSAVITPSAYVELSLLKNISLISERSFREPLYIELNLEGRRGLAPAQMAKSLNKCK